MRIGLISDTHIPEARHELWPQVFDAFRGVDAILHAGDIHDLVVIDQLHDIAPTWAARGNGEDGSGGRPIQPDHPRLREAWLLELEGLKVGLVHDVPIPEYPPHLTLERALKRYFGTAELDVLVSVFAPNSLAHAVWHTRPGVYIRRELEANGVHYGVLAETWRDLDPARYRPALAKERILLMSAAYDRYVDLADAEALWRAWGEPARIVYLRGHAGLVLERRRIGREIIRFLGLK